MREIYSQLPMLLMLLVGAAAVRWGDRQVRGAAAVTALGYVATLAAQAYAGRAAPWELLTAVDVMAFLAFLALAARRVRAWIVLVVSAQGVAAAVHVIRALAPAMSNWAYLTSLALAGYVVLAALAWGVWLSQRAGQSAR